MDPTQLALLALFIGALIGCAATVVIFLSLRTRDRLQEETSLVIPEGIREVMHAMADPAVVVDRSSTVLAASADAAGFGLSEGEVLPGDELKTLARQARATSEVAVVETLRLRRGPAPAEPRPVVVRARSVSAQLVLLVFRDISEQERVEEMRRDFVANTSHELKTPVGAITLLSEAIESASDDPEQVRVFASRISAEATRLALLTSRIMSLSRLQSGDDIAGSGPISLDGVIVGAIDAHLVAAESAGVEIKRGGAKGLYVSGDAQILGEAVGNLIANAIAYSPAGSTVAVGVKDAGGIVEVAIADKGIGIPEADQARVFERFYRSDQARSRRTGGTGLGLSIVKYAVQRHGGEVVLWSRPGRGSTFTVRLPLVEAPPDAAPAERKRKRKKNKAKADAKAPKNGEAA